MKKVRLLFFYIFTLAIVFTGSACSTMQNTRALGNLDFDALLKLADLNERAFFYHHYCESDDEEISETFQRNYEIAPNLLFDMILERTPMKLQTIVDQIVQRRDRLHKKLRRYYNKHGCNSEEARWAHEHYRLLSTPDKFQKTDWPLYLAL